jgi:predicted amidohydrolase
MRARVTILLLVAACGASSSGGASSEASSEGGSGSGSGSASASASGSESTEGSAGSGSSEGGSSSSGDASSSSGAPDLPPAIGLVQYDGDGPLFGDRDANLAALTTWAEAAIEHGAKIIVLPEGSTYGYASSTELWCAPGLGSFMGRTCRDVSIIAETLPGGFTTDYWATFAAEHDVFVVYHVPEVDGSTYYASLGVVDANGFVTRYRKRSLYYVDEAYATPGNESVVLATPYGDFGLMICLDGTYDGPYYDAYVNAGVDGIIIAMDWDDDPDGPAAAIEWFRDRADTNGVRIYAADVSTWDGTGLYLPGDVPRERNGLPAIAIDVDGISVHELP